MPNFKIEEVFNKEDFIRIHIMKWGILWKKNLKSITQFSIGSIILLTLWILTRTDKNPYNPYLLIGIIFTICLLILLYIRFLSKLRYKQKIKSIAEKYESIRMDCSYEFSDHSIKYWDKEKSIEFNWSVFTNYSIYRNFLIIWINQSLIEFYIFESKENDNYNKILEIVKSKLEYKAM